MKKNLWILGGLVAMAFTACTEDDRMPAGGNTVPGAGEKVSITAYTPGGKDDSRIAFTENNDNTISLSWEQGETISVIRGGKNQTFKKADDSNTFEGTLPTQGEGTYYAFYPANANATDHTAVPYDLSVQTGGLNTNSTYMYAASRDGQAFQFYHSTAILKAKFSNAAWTADTKIKQIKVVTPIATQGTANLTDGTLTDTGANLITISYEEPVAVATDHTAYIYLPPMPAENKTLTFMVTTNDNKTYSAILSGDSDKDIEAGKVYSADVALTPMNYLMFVADGGEQSLEIDASVTGLQYSTDGVKWDPLGVDTHVGFVNKLLFLRGKNSNGTGTATISFNKDKVKVACLGDIRTLVDYENYTADITGNATFGYLFYDCTSLTTAPELPATTLANSCYYAMFEGCTSLTTAPELPATTLARDCYYKMFEGCTSLKTAPALPATKLANNCYYFMFDGCTSLESAPALPAETLASGCYRSMFSGCTSLTTAPELPATKLAYSCYSTMFYGCTSLNSVTMLATNISASSCLANWLNGVAENGTLTHAQGMDIPGVPSGWTKVAKQ